MQLYNKIQELLEVTEQTKARNAQILEVAKENLSAHIETSMQAKMQEVHCLVQSELKAALEQTPFKQTLEQILQTEREQLRAQLEQMLRAFNSALEQRGVSEFEAVLKSVVEKITAKLYEHPSALYEPLNQQLRTELLGRVEDALTQRLSEDLHEQQAHLSQILEAQIRAVQARAEKTKQASS